MTNCCDVEPLQVAVPLPKPVDMWPDASLENFEYKLSLSFDGEHVPINASPSPVVKKGRYRACFEHAVAAGFDEGERYHTPWLYILGKKQTGVPLVEVELVRSGTHLQAVKAKVRVAMDPAMQRCSMNVCYLSHIQMDTARRFVTKHGFKSHFDMSRSGCHCPQVGW